MLNDNETQNVNQNETRQNFANSDDPTFLAVKGKGKTEDREDTKSYVKQLASAIITTFQKHGSAKMRCIGAASVNNAVKSACITKGELSKKGINVALVPSFTTVVFDDVERTAIILEVIKI